MFDQSMPTRVGMSEFVVCPSNDRDASAELGEAPGWAPSRAPAPQCCPLGGSVPSTPWRVWRLSFPHDCGGVLVGR